jgi:hypothetical protein
MRGNIYYVYEHWRPDTNACFYVGKGAYQRAWDLKNNRNVRHMSIVSQLTASGLIVDVRIVIRDISSESALSVEKDRIAFYGVENLANMNRGGGGVIRHSPEALAKISATSKGRKSLLGHKHTPETKARLREIGIASVDTFRKYSQLGPKASSKRVICLDDGTEFESASAAARYYGLKSAVSVTAVCRGVRHRYAAAGKRLRYVEVA